MAENNIDYTYLEVQVAGVPYQFVTDPELYTEQDLIDFAPRSGGGDVAYANLDLYQIWTQDSWHHGLGFIQARDKFGFRNASASAVRSGGVDTRHIGMATLFTDGVGETYGALPNFKAVGGIDFKGRAYVFTGFKGSEGVISTDLPNNGIYRRAPNGVWSLVYETSKCLGLFSTDQYLYALLDYDRMLVSADGTTWLAAGVGTNPPYNFEKMTVHGGYFWGAETDRTNAFMISGATTIPAGNYVRGDTVEATGSLTAYLSQLAVGDFVNDDFSNHHYWRVVKITDDTHVTLALQVSFAALPGGLFNVFWRWRENLTHLALHFWSLVDASDAEGGGTADTAAILVGPGGYHCRGLCSFNGALHVARDDGVWAVDETVTPPVARRVLDFSSEASPDNFRVFIPWKGRLYFNVGNVLYAYTGASLANVTPPTIDLNFPPTSFGGFDSAAARGSYLFVLVQVRASTVGGCVLAFDGTGWHRLYEQTQSLWGLWYSPSLDCLFVSSSALLERLQFNALNELPYPYFPTSDHHYLNLSEIDAGFRRVTKSFAEIDLEVQNCTASRYVQVQASPDGGAFQTIGTAITNGVNKFEINPTIQANKLEVRMDFQTADGAQTPVLRNITVKYMVRPDVLYGHRLVVVGADEIHTLDGRVIKATSEVQRAWLRAARASKAPVTFTTPWGTQKTGYISTLRFGNLQRRAGESRSNWRATLNVVEVKP